DHVLLTAAAELAKGIGIPAPLGTGQPLTDDVVLDAQETATIEARLAAFHGITGGVFSYDGVHPTPFGYAFVANAFIDAINAKFGAQIPEADLSPFMFGPPA